MNPTGTIIGGGSDVFTRPADTTQYAAGDRISADVEDTGTTALRALFTAKRVGSKGYITKLLLQTNLATFTDVIRVHFFTTPTPPTAIPGDNAAMGVVFANRSGYLGSLVFAALAEPIATSVSDLAQAVLSNQKFGFQCAKGVAVIYYALQTEGTGTPASGQQFFLKAETEE